MSLSQHTKHIKAKYFLIKDYYDAGVIDVKFCPTDQMWADVLTKPLQGQKFRDMQAFLQNCPQDYEDDTEVVSPMMPQDVASSRECVGENMKSPLKTRTASATCVSQTSWRGGKSVLVEKQDEYISSKQKLFCRTYMGISSWKNQKV
jgi:hypothetical protein